MACFEVIRNRYHTDNDSWLEVIKRAIYLRQVSMYGGYKTITVVSFGALQDSEYTEKVDETVEIPGTRQIDLSWRAKLTTYQGFLQANMYEILETPEHIYTCDDARDVRPFITRYELRKNILTQRWISDRLVSLTALVCVPWFQVHLVTRQSILSSP